MFKYNVVLNIWSINNPTEIMTIYLKYSILFQKRPVLLFRDCILTTVILPFAHISSSSNLNLSFFKGTTWRGYAHLQSTKIQILAKSLVIVMHLRL